VTPILGEKVSAGDW